MSTTNTDRETGTIRETYEEIDVGDVRIGIIADPDNGSAWIQSDVTREVEP